MNAKFLVIILFFVLNFSLSSLADNDAIGDVFFKKQLTTNETLIVFRKEEILNEAMKDGAESLNAMTNANPNMRLVLVQNAFSYTLCDETNGQLKKVWSKKFNFHSRGPAVPTGFKMLDLIKDGENFHILYKENANIFAEKVVFEKGGRYHAMSPALLNVDKPAFGKIGVSGKFYLSAGTNICSKISCADNSIKDWSFDGSRWHSSN